MKKRIGIIGCGQVSRVGHGPAIMADGRAQIAAIADPDRENRDYFQRKFRVTAAFADHRDMLDRQELDAVVIASPPWVHRGQFEDCVKRHLHVLCEKPLATTLDDCQIIDRLSKETDRVIQICHSKRFETGFEKIKQWIDAGRLGEIYQFGVNWHYYIPDFTEGWLRRAFDLLSKAGIDVQKNYGAWRYFDARNGGGDFFDHGPHYIDLIRFFFGAIDSIYCTTRQFHKGEGWLFEDLAVAVFSLSNGAVAVMEKSHMVVGRPSGFEVGYVYGEKGKITFEAIQEYKRKPMKLKRYGFINIIPDLHTPVFLPRGKRNTLYYRQMRHFIDRVSGVERSLVKGYPAEWGASAEDAMMAVAWTLAAYRSAREKREIRREELFDCD